MIVLLLYIVSQGRKANSNRYTDLADCGGDTLHYIRENNALGGVYWRKEHRDFFKDFVIWDKIGHEVVKQVNDLNVCAWNNGILLFLDWGKNRPFEIIFVLWD